MVRRNLAGNFWAISHTERLRNAEDLEAILSKKVNWSVNRWTLKELPVFGWSFNRK
jgi:hypothetical protein